MREHLKRYIDQGPSPNIRGLRILLEFFYASEKLVHLKRWKIPVVSVFGSARATPNHPAYRRAYEIGKRLYQGGYAVVTGASRGVMEAANQGVSDAIAQSIRHKKKISLKKAMASAAYRQELRKYSLGLRISLPKEEEENPWVGSAATFHYFMIRKFFFATLSRAFIACEGGWGTRDEMFEMLTLVQTGKAPLLPIIYVSRNATHLKKDFLHAVKEKYIDPDDLHLIKFVKSPASAVKIIDHFYRRIEFIDYFRGQNIRLTARKKHQAQLKRALKAAWPKYKKFFKDYRWKGRNLELLDFKGRSYGTLRKLIDTLNH